MLRIPAVLSEVSFDYPQAFEANDLTLPQSGPDISFQNVHFIVYLHPQLTEQLANQFKQDQAIRPSRQYVGIQIAVTVH
jgi:hypothetical protein